MKYKIMIMALVMVFTLPAFAEYVTISRAYELDAAQVSVPVSANSRIQFSRCDQCEKRSAQLTEETLFTVGGETVNFQDFCDAMRLAKQSERTAMLLEHHLKSDTVISVSVSL